MTLGGNVVIRNGNELDFCWQEAIQSLLPVCDTVLVCDAGSTDGTQEEVREWMRHERRLQLCVWPWPEPKGDPEFFVNWINYAREHVQADYQIQLDADEVLDDQSYSEIFKLKERPKERKFSVVCDRLNFWGDHQHLIPEGQCCGKHVVRIAPQEMWLASDGAHPKGDAAANLREPSGIRIFHYGFIRRPAAFFAKERLLQGYFFNHYDPRLEKAERHPGNWMRMEGVTDWEDQLVRFDGEHPKVAREWLRERGYVMRDA